MPKAYLDSSVAIGLAFRNAGERESCRKAVPVGATPVCSRYVSFEIARGFLRSLITLHNSSLEFESFADLFQAAHSGQRRFRPYQMHTWLGAFDDYFAELERQDGKFDSRLMLEELRAKLRGWIRRGWRKLGREFETKNLIGCREDLPDPTVTSDGLIDQSLPSSECGSPNACGLQSFIETNRAPIAALATGMNRFPSKQRDSETLQRIDALGHLLDTKFGMKFNGRKCYDCGDALICLEAPVDASIVTKNKKHFEPIADLLGKSVSIAISDTTATAKKQ